jgi:hypothetical protein
VELLPRWHHHRFGLPLRVIGPRGSSEAAVSQSLMVARSSYCGFHPSFMRIRVGSPGQRWRPRP